MTAALCKLRTMIDELDTPLSHSNVLCGSKVLIHVLYVSPYGIMYRGTAKNSE